MLDAMPKERKWVLTQREALADYLDKLDKSLREKLKKSRCHDKTPEQQLVDLIQTMSEEQQAQLLKTDESVGALISRLMKRRDTNGQEPFRMTKQERALTAEEAI
jgi:hypothetical protein